LNIEPHVLVDATAIPRNRGGVGRNLEYLIPALEAQGVRLTVVAQPHDVEWIAAAAPRARVFSPGSLPGARPLRLAWEQLALPGIARSEGADVVFSPHYTMPLFSSVPVVVALYDAIFFSNPELHSPLKRIFFRFWIKRSLARAAACIAPSEATKSELLRWVKPRRDRISVALLGVDSGTFHVPTEAERDDARQLVGHDDWIAFLGTLEPRKNVGSLVRAFSEFATRPEIAAAHPDLVLALAGGRGWDTELDGIIAESPVNDRILRLGFVPNELLAGVLGASITTVYPSLGEGFGFPVLEAMACGSPILTTRLLSLPEVGGDVAVYTEPDPASIASALEQLFADPAGRARRGHLGVARAAGFSWSASAAAHAKVFASVAAPARASSPRTRTAR
jgi:glycosyltransferase involved in cell wall biosynthesis